VLSGFVPVMRPLQAEEQAGQRSIPTILPHLPTAAPAILDRFP
jgi:hypothetical protein